MTTPITRIAIIGAGVIAASWATAFLARGMDVVANDPAPGAEEALRKTVDAQWPAMQQIGLSPGASRERLRFAASPEDAVDDHDQRVPRRMYAPPGARRARPSVQPAAPHSTRRGGRRQTDRARRDRASVELLSRDGQAPDPSAPRDRGPCREPAAGGA